MKKSFVTLALLIGFTTLGFASTQPVVKSLPANEISPLTTEEQALLERLTNELDYSLEQVLASIEDTTEIEKVLVYDAKGNLIETQEGEIDFEALPEGASPLMLDGTTYYFIIL